MHPLSSPQLTLSILNYTKAKGLLLINAALRTWQKWKFFFHICLSFYRSIALGHLFDDNGRRERCVNIFHVKFTRGVWCSNNVLEVPTYLRVAVGPFFIIDYLRRFFMFQLFFLIPESSQRSNYTISTKTTSKWTGHFSKWPSIHDPRKFRCTDRTGKIVLHSHKYYGR